MPATPTFIDVPNQTKRVQFVDLRKYGAVCDWNGTTGTNNVASVLAAIADGHTMIFQPANCMWIAAGAPPEVPADIYILGEDWVTSVIQSNANPFTQSLLIGKQTRLQNLNIRCVGTNDPSHCPMFLYVNCDDTLSHHFVSTVNQAITLDASTTFDSAPLQVRQEGTGDAIYVEAADPLSGPPGNGVGLRALNSSTGGGFSIMAQRQSSGGGIFINDRTSAAATGDMMTISSDHKTGGDMLNMTQTGTAWASGYGIFMDYGRGGSFADACNFMICTNNSVVKFVVHADGHISINGIDIWAGTGDPNGSIAGPMGSLYSNKSGGAGTTLYVKESGGSGGSGWVAK